MRILLIKLLMHLLSKEGRYIPVRTNHKITKRGQFTFDTYRMEFYDKEGNKRYILRPTGNPVPYIVDELAKMVGNMKDAVDIYSKFTRASAEVTKKGHNAFKVKVFKY